MKIGKHTIWVRGRIIPWFIHNGKVSFNIHLLPTIQFWFDRSGTVHAEMIEFQFLWMYLQIRRFNLINR